MIGKTISHYQILGQLGEGGMGVVYKARDKQLDRLVALKVLNERFAGDPARQARFAREAKAIAALNHPRIVTIYSVESIKGLYFLTMELVDGEPLNKQIPEQGLRLEDFLRLAIPVAEAVSAAHERGIIHCGLKPSNILLTRTGEIKILDFGLARFWVQDSSQKKSRTSSTLSQTSGFSGTVCYMSPEQIRGEALDHRSDLFSLGIVLYEMATGKRPFPGGNPPDLMASILKDNPKPVDELNPGLPHWLGMIIGHCLEKDVRRRMQSALDLLAELEQLKVIRTSSQEEHGPSIAVLPFTDMSREKDQEYFCDGMAEEIINALSQIKALRVASRTSTLQYKGAVLDSREIGRRLGVSTLLEGSVRKSGNRVRINVQLINVNDGYRLWVGQYDRDYSDVFAIQEEIARNIVQALQVTLTPHEGQALKQAPTSNVQAYDYYLRGRKFIYQYGNMDIEFALQLFSRAIALDPTFSLAYAGLADCWSYIYLYSERTQATWEQADAASLRAVELAPESGQAQASRAVTLSLCGRDDEAEKAFEKAIRLDPNLFEAYYFYARHCFVRGQLDRAAIHYEQAMRVRPEDYQAPLLVAQIYEGQGRPEEALAARRKGVSLVEVRLKVNPTDTRAMYMGANGLVALGEKERASEWAALSLSISPNDSMLLYNVGCIYSLLGRTEEAIDCLERSVKNGLTQKGWFEHDDNLDPIRQHPRFQEMLRKLS
jgi:serine/threonine protein kinase/cytochrome c-type biogenesis protein CcmH/NrfG